MSSPERLSVKVDKQGLEARVVLSPASRDPGGHPEPHGAALPSVMELEVILRERGVQGQMDYVALQSALASASFGSWAEAVAARGIPPEPGKDGYLELLVENIDHKWPAWDAEGSVDFKTTRFIRNVQPGQPLALVHSPTPGKPGRDVFGRPLPAPSGKQLEPRLGPNTRRSEHDSNLIVATVAGHLTLFQGVPEIQECYVVEGDVDYSTGNVSFAKSVLIKGDVKGGFAVSAGGDVEIWGMAEDCEIASQGKVLVKGGFSGGGKGMLQAKGQIHLGYVRNQAVRGEGDVLVAREAVNAKLQSRTRVAVDGLLAGGRTQALMAVECKIAGTDKGVPTFLEAGVDFGLADQINEAREQLEMVGRHLKRLEDGLRQVQDLEKLHRGLERWVIELVFEMERMRSKVDAKIIQLTERAGSLERRNVAPADAKVTVHRAVHPGVVIKIGREVMRIDQPMTGPKTFTVRDGQIIVT